MLRSIWKQFKNCVYNEPPGCFLQAILANQKLHKVIIFAFLQRRVKHEWNLSIDITTVVVKLSFLVKENILLGS